MTGDRSPACQPWAAIAGFAILLHFPWEMLQAPFYAGMAEAPHWDAVWTCTVATMGDALIALAAYGGAAAVLRDRAWLRRPRARGIAAYLVLGLAITVVLEALNVYVWTRWTYAPPMPQFLGIGLTPLVQWLLLPPLTLWLARRHLASGPSDA